MQATETKPSTNGVVRLRRRGRVKFQFEDDDATRFEIDVIEVYDQWHEIDWAHREQRNDADGKESGWFIPNAKWNEYCQDRLNFVQAIVNDAYAKLNPPQPAPVLCRAEAEEFIHQITEEANKLRDFTGPKNQDPSSSSPDKPEMRINFSQ